MELTEPEQKLYEELFQRCDLAKTTKIPVLVAGELFSSSGLPTETSLKIAEMCGAARLGYFGRSQFYIALKYIAAAQQQIPLNPEVVGATNLPLPRINRVALNSNLTKHTYDAAAYPVQAEPQPPPQIPMVAAMGVLPPPPTKKHVRNMSGTIQSGPATGHPSQLNNSHVTPAGHNTASVAQVGDRSQPIGQGEMSEPVGWASFPSAKNNKTDLSISKSMPAHSHTAATAPVVDPPASPDWNTGGSSCGVSKKSFNIDSCSLSSADYATSETSESTDDIWVINDEQREYYVNQFRSMQSDLTATIKGPVAKEFFEKSKLPNNELSKIWKLSDVNRDGELTLQEFCTAMHLVVLKRNLVELPTTLPPSLMPYVPASSEPFAADLDEEDRESPVSSAPPAQNQNSWAGMANSTDGPSNWSADPGWTETQRGSVSNDHWTNSEQQWQQTGSEVSSVQWAAGASESGSPMQAQWTGSSHSPTSKPIQFDSTPALIVDTDIAVPVAVKMSPSTQNKIIDIAKDATEDSGGPSANAASEKSNATEGALAGQTMPVRPRPMAKKAQSMGVTAVDPVMKYPPPQSVHGYQSLPGTNTNYIPPTVPPRNPWPVQSPDADLWAVEAGAATTTATGDNEHPFYSQKGDNENFADFSTKFGEPTNETFGAPSSLQSNAVGDSAHPNMHPVMLPTVSVPKSSIAHQFSIRDKKEIQNSIRKQRERNEILVRSSGELHSELQEVVEQRISLEIQLEHLKPC